MTDFSRANCLLLTKTGPLKLAFRLFSDGDGNGQLPARNGNERYNFRNKRIFSVPRKKTKRFRNTFIMHYCRKAEIIN